MLHLLDIDDEKVECLDHIEWQNGDEIDDVDRAAHEATASRCSEQPQRIFQTEPGDAGDFDVAENWPRFPHGGGVAR